MRAVFERRKKNKRNDFVFPSLKKGFEQTHIQDDRGSLKVINKLMPNLKKAPRVGNKVLRHTFATLGYGLFNDMGVLDRITGHISGSFNSRLATSVYVHMQADQHRDYFERLNAELCNTEDSQGVNWDEIIIPRDAFEEIDELLEIPLKEKYNTPLKGGVSVDRVLTIAQKEFLKSTKKPAKKKLSRR